MKVLVKFASGIDRIQNEPSWVMTDKGFETATPECPCNLVIAVLTNFTSQGIPIFRESVPIYKTG